MYESHTCKKAYEFLCRFWCRSVCLKWVSTQIKKIMKWFWITGGKIWILYFFHVQYTLSERLRQCCWCLHLWWCLCVLSGIETIVSWVEGLICLGACLVYVLEYLNGKGSLWHVRLLRSGHKHVRPSQGYPEIDIRIFGLDPFILQYIYLGTW